MDKKKNTAFAIIFWCMILYGFVFAKKPPMEIHCKHFFYGYPLGTPTTNDLVIRDIYALSNNDKTRFADWVAYRLSWREVESIADFNRTWRKDPYLDDDETLEPKDYEDAFITLAVDRGHQAPLGSFGGTIYASDSNYLSNITPQKIALNQGPWRRLEARVRNIVRKGKVVYVMTGPLYEKKMRELPRAKKPHKVPSGYWKIVILEGKGVTFDSAAFIFDQDTPADAKVIDFLTTIDEVEKRSGLDFLWMLDDAIEKSVEKRKNSAFASEYFESKRYWPGDLDFQ